MKKNLFFMLILVIAALPGCAKRVLLEEISKEAASAALSPARSNPALLQPRTADAGTTFKIDPRSSPKTEQQDNRAPDNSLEDIWIQVEVAALILAMDKNLEKFEEGALRGQAVSGEMFEGNFSGYRPKTEHCTRSWLGNLYYFDSRGGYIPLHGGFVTLKGNKGTVLVCAYDWSNAACSREGLCKAKDDTYYRFSF